VDFTHDVTGRTVREGDIVGGTTSGRYQATITGPVTAIGKDGNRVKILIGTTTRRLDAPVDTEKWIDSDRIFLVAVRPADLPETGEWTPEDDETVRTRATEAAPTRYVDPLVPALLARITHLDALADAYRADSAKLSLLEFPLEKAWRKIYAPDMDEVADIFGWQTT
jgi:hypothetical protein